MESIIIPYRANRFAGYVIAIAMAPLVALSVIAASSGPPNLIAWVGLAVFLCFGIYGGLLVRASHRPVRQIELTDTHIIAPKSALSCQTVRIPYTDVRYISWFPKYLGILHRKGLLWVTKASLPDSEAFDLFYETLKRRSTPTG